MTKTVSLSFRVAPDKAEKLDRLASATDRPRSSLLEQALDAYLELQAWQIEHVKQGIEDSRAGRVVAHEEVAAWLDTWGTQVSTWGDSLGVRLPKDVAARVGLREGSRVEITAEDDRIIVAAKRPVYTLDELLVGVTPKAMHEAFDSGPGVGHEDVE